MRHRLLSFAAGLGLAAAGSAAWAATPLETAVREVTVYPDGQARVVRDGETSLTAGSAELLVADLPAAVVRDSVGVSVAAGDVGVRVGSVEVERQPVSGPPRAREQALRERLETLEADQAAAADRVETARTQLTFVEGLADLPKREGAGESLTGKEAAARWPDLWQRIGEGSRQAREAMRQASARKQALEDEIKAAQKALDQLGQGRRERTRIRVGLEADRAAAATVSLRYRVRGAHWQQRYEARLDTDSGRMTLVRKARVRQATGTDWRDVRLALATVAPVSGPMPELATWWVDFGQPQPVRAKAATLGAADRAAEAEPAAPSWTAHGEFTPVYRVAGAVSVPGSNQPRTVVLGRSEMDGRLAVRVVPQRGERAWLTAAAAWDGAGALPPGPVDRYRDGAFVGEGRLAAWSPGEERHLAFGLDPRFEVAMRAVTDEAGREGLISKREVRTRHFRIELTNRHARAVDGSLRFRIPVARDEAIEVAPWFPQAPDREDVDARKGVYAWDRSFPAGETVVIQAGYRLSVPAGKRVPGF
ncbi:MAG TPA: mucoidy inhibitor MuiA family protein [Gammaproteobacteria bacterium]|nr:mucoidy inhibitor MuiA family protein [Gammaproteobacteria bacterium]